MLLESKTIKSTKDNKDTEVKKFGGTHGSKDKPKDNSSNESSKWYGTNTGIPPAPKPEVIRSGMWKGSEGVGGKDPDASGAYDSQGNLNPGWVLDRGGKPHWAPLWKKEDAQALRYSIDDTVHRIQELRLELETKQKLISDNFYQGLTPGELVQCTGIAPEQRIYGEVVPVSGGFGPVRESFEVFPGLSPGQTLMFLGLVASPGEEITLTGDGGSQKVWTLSGPKWLIEDKVYIASLPMGLIEPYEVEIEDEFAQNLGLDLEKLSMGGIKRKEGEDD